MSSAKRRPFCLGLNVLTHWGRVTHICVGKLTIIGSDNGLSPGWHQAIIWTNAGILLIGPLGTNLNKNLYRKLYMITQENAFVNVVCKMAAIFSRLQHVNSFRIGSRPHFVLDGSQTSRIRPYLYVTDTQFYSFFL